MHGYTQPYMAIYSYKQLYMAIHSHTWLHPAIHGYTQLYTAFVFPVLSPEICCSFHQGPREGWAEGAFTPVPLFGAIKKQMKKLDNFFVSGLISSQFTQLIIIFNLDQTALC